MKLQPLPIPCYFGAKFKETIHVGAAPCLLYSDPQFNIYTDIPDKADFKCSSPQRENVNIFLIRMVEISKIFPHNRITFEHSIVCHSVFLGT